VITIFCTIRQRSRICLLALLVFCLGTVTRSAAATRSLAAGDDLQAALDAAQPGDEILLASGATYSGNFVLPRKSGEQVIVVRTNADAAALPAAGVRTAPNYGAVLAKIRSPNTGAAMTAAPGAHHWRLEDLEFQSNRDGIGDIIVLGGSQAQTDRSQLPHDIILDRLYIHGDPGLGQKRGIALNSGYTEVRNSYISEIKSSEQDSQAIAGWNGSGPFVIENNYLEASGENILFGGADPSVAGLVPSDITIRRNLLSKPLAWRAQKWVVKNALELKNARRVLIEGNVFENVWVSGQSGFAVLFTPANQDGHAPWVVVEDVTFRYNIVRHAGGGVNVTGVDAVSGSDRTQRVQIANNLFYDIDGQWGGPGTGVFLQLGNGPRDVVVERNTIVHSGNLITVYGTSNGAPSAVDGFGFRENLAKHNVYGVIGDGESPGRATLSAYFARVLFDRNVLAGGDPSAYPAGNYFPSVAEFDASFTNEAAADFRLVSTSPFAHAAADGTALGADLTRLYGIIGGGAPPSDDAGSQAVCKSGYVCTDPGVGRRRR
jgi:hypothetical protein